MRPRGGPGARHPPRGDPPAAAPGPPPAVPDARAAAGRPGRQTPSRDASAVVVLGPAHGDPERAVARAAAFELVEAAGRPDRVGHWRSVAAAVAAAGAEVVGVPLHGARVSDDWLA